MFTEMRRSDKAKPAQEAERILAEALWGTLALTLDDGYPYSVPISHIYREGCIYFHSATAGQKYVALLGDPKVCFSAVEESATRALPGRFSMAYASAIAFGQVSLVEGESEMIRILELITEKYDPAATPESTAAYIKAHLDRCCVFKITVEHLTGKGFA